MVGGGEITGQQHQHHYQKSQQQQQLQLQHLVLLGGKEDLSALAMSEDRVKKLKSLKASPCLSLNSTQVDSALDNLADWVYDCFGLVSFSYLGHPKFKAFLNRVALPSVSKKELAGERLDVKYAEAKAESEVKILDAMFFQIGSDGWKSKNYGHVGEENLLKLGFNQRIVPFYLWVYLLTGLSPKALKNLENQHHLMVNLTLRLIFLHANSFGFKCNASFLRWISANAHSRAVMYRTQKLIFVAARSKLQRQDFTRDEDKDAEFLIVENGGDNNLGGLSTIAGFRPLKFTKQHKLFFTHYSRLKLNSSLCTLIAALFLLHGVHSPLESCLGNITTLEVFPKTLGLHWKLQAAS
ncbi:hypothetical protein POM88_053798 [Heracleum sosnowskyi]|uniref:Uncharacterized protein n=1 Tax=Heracleum sosnowskyi TaxID=360622 RepID=A0AAD8LXR9_9APIA|nr:hypothetical protein POM88_053798 [Heracleum sosnowskyi]